MSAHATGQNSGLRRIILALLCSKRGFDGVADRRRGATSLISLAQRIHPVAGTAVFWYFVWRRDFLRSIA